MKLLIVTQAVDRKHSVLGFFHRWIEEFAKHYQQVIVVCLEKGEYNFSENVKVLSLGKEASKNKLAYLYRFYKYIWRERKSYDSVFVHMNVEYVILAGWLWKWWRKKIGLWYVHRAVTWKLKLAEKLADVIFTASEKSFRLPSGKVAVVGHGIDIDMFKPDNKKEKEIAVLMVGRISPTKRQLEGVKIFASILQSFPQAKMVIIGKPVFEKDQLYLEKIKSYLKDNDLVNKVLLKGAIPHSQLPAYYNSALVLLNLSATGSLDKDVLEALACDTLVVTSNEAFFSLLPPQFTARDLSEAEEIVKNVLSGKLEFQGRAIVAEKFSLSNTIAKISNYL